VPFIVTLPEADAQIASALAFTLERFGEAKFQEYLRLIRAATDALMANPLAGKKRPDIHPDAWTYHIARQRRTARHLFLYRIREEVEVARFLYDAMDLRRHWPPDWDKP
jgi:plasmid stabilization system protein ParE